MSYKAINPQKKDHVMVVYVHCLANDKPEMILLPDELRQLCNEIAWDENIRVVVFGCGVEKVPYEETDLVKGVSADTLEREIELQSFSGPISKLDCPVVAAISGDAIGQGLELALACDIRIASETSHFGLSQIKSGVIPSDGGTQRLARLVGRGKALEMILTGELIDAQEALRVGLVHRVVSKNDLMDVVMKLSGEMASKGPIALRYAKEAIHKGMDVTLEQGLRLEADLYLLIHSTRDRTEGIQAFREKRAPKFEGK